MRVRLLVLAAMLALGVPYLGAQQQSSDEVAIRAVLARETDGWNRFDAGQVASTFTSDAVWQNPFGVRLHGQAEIRKFVTDLLARPGYRAGTSTAPTKILDLRLTSPTTASVWSDERIEGLVNDNSGHPMQPRHSYYLKVLVKQAGEWKISDALIMDIVHPQQVAWLEQFFERAVLHLQSSGLRRFSTKRYGASRFLNRRLFSTSRVSNARSSLLCNGVFGRLGFKDGVVRRGSRGGDARFPVGSGAGGGILEVNAQAFGDLKPSSYKLVVVHKSPVFREGRA